MKISLNWLKEYVKIPSEMTQEELVRLIGARLVEVEGVTDETHKYDKIFVVKVVRTEKIPDTHLTKCLIDVGKQKDLAKVEYEEDGMVQVMCGAPNVREGMLAVWIAPGAVVPASVNEGAPFVIGKRKMLGQYNSFGMLAGADELDLGTDHSGIVEIRPGEAEPGTPLAEVFELEDLILEIENKSLTHRPDCFGIIGFAREVAGILGQKFQEPNLSEEFAVPTEELPGGIKIEIEDKTICPRYSAVVLEKHGEDKRKYLCLEDTRLCKAGMRPIDKIVDATNYLMLLTGQPLHAFDFDKFVKVGGTDKPEIKVRLAKKGEKIVLLDDTEVVLNEKDIVICSGEKPVALAGAMGGKSTEIDETTRKVILESATFSLYNLRKTQMAHGIFSEAITRFTKGQPAYQTLSVAKACGAKIPGMRMILEADKCADKVKNPEIRMTAEKINGLLGTEYTPEKIKITLENVGFSMQGLGEMVVTAPEWRTDIKIPEDVTEEVGRLLGYDNIQPVLPMHVTAKKNAMFEMKHELRDLLVRYGANEILTYSFVSEKLLEKAGQEKKNSYKIVNSISPELQYIRQSLLPSLLDKAYLNEKLPVEKFVMFEMNQVYRKEWRMNEEGVPNEGNALGLVVAERKGEGTAYYLAKKYVEGILGHFGLKFECRQMGHLERTEGRMLEEKRSAKIVLENGETMGVIGELKNSVRHEFKLAEFVAGAELDLDMLLEKALEKKTTSKKIDFSEKRTEDVTIESAKDYAEVLVELAEKYPGTKISPLSIYQASGQKTRNISFRIEK